MMNDNDEETAPAAAEAEPTTTTTSPQKSPVSVKKNDDGGYSTDVGKYHFEVDAKQVPLVGYFFASIIFMISAIARKTLLQDWYGYALSIGIIGMILGLGGLFLLKYKPDFDQKYLSWFNLLWSVLGACFMTFGDPGKFTATGNGYFSIWAMVIFALYHCGLSTEQVKEQVHGTSSVSGLGIASIIMIIAISYDVGVSSYRGNAIYTLVLSCLTIVLVGGMLFMEHKTDKTIPALYEFIGFTVFAIMWIVAACLVTFNGPFTITGNGYFTAWAAAVLSTFAALNAKQRMNQDDNVV